MTDTARAPPDLDIRAVNTALEKHFGLLHAPRSPAHALARPQTWAAAWAVGRSEPGSYRARAAGRTDSLWSGLAPKPVEQSSDPLNAERTGRMEYRQDINLISIHYDVDDPVAAVQNLPHRIIIHLGHDATYSGKAAYLCVEFRI